MGVVYDVCECAEKLGRTIWCCFYFIVASKRNANYECVLYIYICMRIMFPCATCGCCRSRSHTFQSSPPNPKSETRAVGSCGDVIVSSPPEWVACFVSPSPTPPLPPDTVSMKPETSSILANKKVSKYCYRIVL